MKSLLRKKLFLSALISSVSKGGASSAASSTGIAGNIHGTLHSSSERLAGSSTLSALLSPLKVPPHHANQSADRNQMVRSASGNGSSFAHSSSQGAMLRQLQQSQQKQADLRSLLTSNMTAIYTADHIPAETLKNHKHALRYAQKLSLQKVLAVTDKYFLYHQRRGFAHWVQIVGTMHVERQCLACTKSIAAYQLVQGVTVKVIKRLYKAMGRWKLLVERQQTLEKIAATAEIQRVWRGGLVRLHMRNRGKVLAATVIQKYARRMISTTRVKRTKRQLLQRKQLKRVLALIDRRWQFQRKKRVLKIVFAHYHRLSKTKKLQRVYRGHRGRLRYKHFRAIYVRVKSTLLIQCAARRHIAKQRVKRIQAARKQLRAIIRIQKVVRGVLTRLRLAQRIRSNKAAIRIQYMHLRHKAFKTYKLKLAAHQQHQLAINQQKSAVKIQRRARGVTARRRTDAMNQKRALLRQQKAAALKRLTPVILGHSVREKYTPIIKRNTALRLKNILVIQRLLRAQMLGRKARLFVKNKRIAMANEIKQRKAAVQIQRIVRGKLGRRKAKAAYIAQLRREELAARKPYYFRMRDEYYRTQNLFHRPYVLRLQRAMRCRLARNRVRFMKQSKAAVKIQKLCRCRIAKRKALLVVAERRLHRLTRIRSIVYIQKVARGFRVRRELRKNMRVKMVLWFLKELRCRRMTQRAVKNFRYACILFVLLVHLFIQFTCRNTQTTEQLNHRASVKIQALVRGKQQKSTFKHTHKRLVRQRNQRIKERKHKATVKIQSIFRMRLGRIRVNKQRLLAAEREREKRELDVLEASLEGLHEDFMMELMVIRAQNGIRGMLAKK